MKALRWHGKHDVSVDSVPDPQLRDERDAIVRVTTTAICGSDLHLYDGVIPTMEDGDILGHEFMGVVEEVAKPNGLRKGDRVIVPFQIACGRCGYCQRGLTALCDNTNPDNSKLKTLYGDTAAGLFGYSHLYGGYPGGQAEYVRVPFSDVGPIKVPDSLSDEQVLFLSDIFPTGYMAAENCDIQCGDTIAIWGCGPVGQMAIRSAFLLGAERVIAIDDVPERLRMAADGGAEVLNFDDGDIYERLRAMTAGRGPDACIDAVGLEAHGATLDAYLDKVKAAAFLATDRPNALRQAIHCCRKGGIVSIPGVYGGFLDKIPFGAAFQKGLTFRMGQTHMMKYMRPLLHRIERGEIDPSFVITHRLPLDEAADAYKVFRDKKDECIKVVLKPHSEAVH